MGGGGGGGGGGGAGISFCDRNNRSVNQANLSKKEKEKQRVSVVCTTILSILLECGGLFLYFGSRDSTCRLRYLVVYLRFIVT